MDNCNENYKQVCANLGYEIQTPTHLKEAIKVYKKLDKAGFFALSIGDAEVLLSAFFKKVFPGSKLDVSVSDFINTCSKKKKKTTKSD